MATTISFTLDQDLTAAQAKKVGDMARSYVAHLARGEGGMAAELDRRIETDRITEESYTDWRDGNPIKTDLTLRHLREAVLYAPLLFTSLKGAWSNLPLVDRDLRVIDDFADRDWSTIRTHKDTFAAVFADPMWGRKTARSAEIDGQIILAEQFISGIAINPAHPPVSGVAEVFRSEIDMNFWWGRPYICQAQPDGGYIVECLDGGAWDRPTQHAFVETVEEAVEIALRLIDE